MRNLGRFGEDAERTGYTSAGRAPVAAVDRTSLSMVRWKRWLMLPEIVGEGVSREVRS